MRCYLCSTLLTDTNHEHGKEICYNCDQNNEKEKTNAITSSNKRNKSS